MFVELALMEPCTCAAAHYFWQVAMQSSLATTKERKTRPVALEGSSCYL